MQVDELCCVYLVLSECVCMGIVLVMQLCDE